MDTKELAAILNHLTLAELKLICKTRSLGTNKRNKPTLINNLIQSKLALSELPLENIHAIATKMKIFNTTDKRDTIVAIEEKTRLSNIEKSKSITEVERPLIKITPCSFEEGRKIYREFLLENNLLANKEDLDKEWKGYDPFLLRREETFDE